MSSASYYLFHEGQQRGPYSVDQLKPEWASGAINGQTLYWKEGMEGWKPLEEIKSQLVEAPKPPAAVAPPPPPAPPAPVVDPEADKPLYYTFHNGQQTGPHSINQLRTQHEGGQITDAATFYWKEGMAGWVSVKELADKLKPAAVATTTIAAASTTTTTTTSTTATASAVTIKSTVTGADLAQEIKIGPFQDFVDRDKQNVMSNSPSGQGPFYEVLMDGANAIRFSLEDLQGGWRAGALRPELQFRSEGENGWRVLGEIQNQLD